MKQIFCLSIAELNSYFITESNMNQCQINISYFFIFMYCKSIILWESTALLCTVHEFL